jgi:Flp pilus assembly pilin Flp
MKSRARVNLLLTCLAGDEQGQDLVEYSLLIALIAVVCAGLVQSVGTGYKNLWTTTASMLANASAIAGS